MIQHEMNGDRMNRYEEVFARIADEIAVVSPNSFTHTALGRLRTTREMDPDPEHAVLPHLWRFLYLYYYAGDTVAAAVLLEGSKLVVGVPEWEDPALVTELLAANDATIYPSTGWELTGHDEERLLVRKDGLTLNAGPEEVLAAAPVRVGDRVQVLLPAYRRFAEPRWFLAVSAAGPCPHRTATVTRLYFTPRDSAVARDLLAELSARLNGLGIAFEIKLLNHPSAYARHDPFVVYLDRADWLTCRGEIADVHQRFVSELQDDGPALLGRLGRGWYLADEPTDTGQPVSFGQHRCLLIAEALVRAYVANEQTAGARLDAIARRYREAGLDVSRPYTNEPCEVTP